MAFREQLWSKCLAFRHLCFFVQTGRTLLIWPLPRFFQLHPQIQNPLSHVFVSTLGPPKLLHINHYFGRRQEASYIHSANTDLYCFNGHPMQRKCSSEETVVATAIDPMSLLWQQCVREVHSMKGSRHLIKALRLVCRNMNNSRWEDFYTWLVRSEGEGSKSLQSGPWEITTDRNPCEFLKGFTGPGFIFPFQWLWFVKAL